MPTVQDIYDLAVYDEADTETKKLHAIVSIILRRRPEMTTWAIMEWDAHDFYQVARDIMQSINPGHTSIPDTFTRAFECQALCCKQDILGRVGEALRVLFPMLRDEYPQPYTLVRIADVHANPHPSGEQLDSIRALENGELGIRVS